MISKLIGLFITYQGYDGYGGRGGLRAPTPETESPPPPIPGNKSHQLLSTADKNTVPSRSYGPPKPGPRPQPQYAREPQPNPPKNEPQSNKAPRSPHQTARNPAGTLQGPIRKPPPTKTPIQVPEFPQSHFEILRPLILVNFRGLKISKCDKNIKPSEVEGLSNCSECLSELPMKVPCLLGMLIRFLRWIFSRVADD